MIPAPISTSAASTSEEKLPLRTRSQNSACSLMITGGWETFTVASSWPATELPHALPQPTDEKISPVTPWPQSRLPREWKKPEDSAQGSMTAPVLKVVPRLGGRSSPTTTRRPAQRPQRHRHTPTLFRPRRVAEHSDRSAEASFIKAPSSNSPLSDRVIRYAMGALAGLGCVFVVGLMGSPGQTGASQPANSIDVAARDLTASRRALECFLSAETIPELMEQIRDAHKLVPGVGAWLKAKNQALPLGGRILGKGSKVNLKGHNIVEFVVQKSALETTPIAVMETPTGWLVDWNSFIQQGDMSVAEFLEQRPTEPTMLMVLAQPDSYFNFEYSNSEQYHCLKLMDANYANTFYGYADKSNPQAPLSMSLSTVGAGSQRPIPLAIRARFVGVATSPAQVEITEVLQDGWFDQ